MSDTLIYISDDRLVETLKSSPHNGPGTPRDDGTPGNAEMGYGSLHYQDGINPVTVRGPIRKNSRSKKYSPAFQRSFDSV